MDSKTLHSLYAKLRSKRRVVYHTPISKQQSFFPADAPAEGNVWVSRLTIAGNGEAGVAAAVKEAIELTGDGTEIFTMPACEDITAEWVSCRPGGKKEDPEPKVPENWKYFSMLKDLKSDVVMLYAHGGHSVIGNAASSRPMTSKLAALTGGRVLSVNYRLSPSHPFPSQIIDVLLAYLYLLYPPPGSLHTPVPPSNIVFAADSFGANILLSLLQVILKLNQHFTNSSLNRTITFNNSPVKLPLPAAGAFVSALGYTPEVFPSWDTNKEHDTFPYLPQPYCTTSYFPADAIWPSHPPRGDIYCETSLLAHPILCPSIAKSWHGCPPLYFGEGEERCADSVIVIAQQAVRDVVKVRWETYEEMCHIFMTYFPRLRQSDLVFERWTDFIMRAVEKPSDVVSGASSIAYDLSERAMDVNRLTEIMVEDATGWMMRVRKERKVWTGPTEGQKGKAVL